MRLKSVREALGGRTEEELQDFLKSAYESDGWVVKNVHQRDPAHENGADLICERGEERHLLAVKRRPVHRDIEQLRKLYERRAEGVLFYAFVLDPTAGFAKEMEKVKKTVTFMGPPELHTFFLHSELLDYLVLYFSTLPITNELAKCVTILWQARNGEIPHSTRGYNDYASIYDLKDAVLKSRSALGVIALRWEYYLMQRTEVPKEEYDLILDDVVRDLDAIQRFTGGNLSDEFEKAHDRTPYILSMIWKVVRGRTDWNHFALRAEKIPDTLSVFLFAKYFWALPAVYSPIPHSKINRDRMRFFCSGLIGILNNLARVAKDLDDGVDWAWRDEFPGKRRGES
jgi:hypothetical protein